MTMKNPKHESRYSKQARMTAISQTRECHSERQRGIYDFRSGVPTKILRFAQNDKTEFAESEIWITTASTTSAFLDVSGKLQRGADILVGQIVLVSDLVERHAPAKLPTTKATSVRVPRMTGLPWQIFGSMTIRPFMTEDRLRDSTDLSRRTGYAVVLAIPPKCEA
jgi:hypothetical protein